MKKLIYIIFISIITNTAFSGWTEVNTGVTYNFTAVTMSTSQIFYATGYDPSTYAGVFFKSTNGGANWFQVPLPAYLSYPQGLNFSGNGLNGVVTGSSVIIMTSDGGLNWSILFVTADTVVLFGVDIRGNNVGSMWAVGNKVSNQSITGTVLIRCPNLQIPNPVCTRMSLPANMSSYQLTSVSAIDSMTCYIGVSDYPVFDGILKTTDKGITWTQVSATGIDIWSVKVERTSGNGFAAGGGTSICGIFRTTNYGASWNQVYTANAGAIKSLSCGAYNYAVGNNGMILKGNYFGDMWQVQNSGITTDLNSVCALDANTDIAVAVGDNGKILITTDGGIGIQNISTEIPASYKLSQNYPNPFNPNTFINFQLPKQNYVTIKIYDALGREVATLVSEQLNAGTYRADWDGSNYSSGMYFYKLTTDNFSETKRMALVK